MEKKERKLVNINDRYIKVQSRNDFLRISCILLSNALIFTLFYMGFTETLNRTKLLLIVPLVVLFVCGGIYFQKRMEKVQGKANQGDRI